MSRREARLMGVEQGIRAELYPESLLRLPTSPTPELQTSVSADTCAEGM